MSNARLYTVAFVVSLAQVTTGLFLGWPSPMIPKLMDSSLKLDEDEASWTVSMLKLGMAVGCILAIFIVDFVGRKISILVTIVPTIASWSIIVWDSTIEGLYVARFIGGIGSGLVFTAGSMYVTEISPPEVRGAIGSCFVIMNYIGGLLGYIIGSFASIDEYAYVAISFSMIQFLMLIWFHETPYYLLRQKRHGAALDSLMFLRGSGGVSEEMDSIMRSVESEPKNVRLFSVIPDLMSKPGGPKTMLLGVCMMIVQAFSGSIILNAYAETIFKNIHNYREKDSYMSIVLATVQLISYILCISLVDRIGRRPLMIISIIGVTICSFILGVYFCLDEEHVNVENLHWLAFTCVLLYATTVSVGLSSLPFVIMNEIFPLYAKTACISFCFFLNFFFSFVLIKVWSIVAFEQNLYTAFWIISALNIFGVLFLVYYLPETKSLSLLRIQEALVCRIRI
ncbi:solute carrier family 2, facilitated glucose transporter member 8-like isoform X2 [Lasioglossum baleicum]|uniref:solute carrier family 2, facilitated glucose transporter member 8-like isoform X2 n=1 Tax=Lasioglossum baleicum TaxID=434251 RepID=UPI003FCE56E7